MAGQKFTVAFTTEGFQQAIGNMRQAQVAFDKSLESSAKAVEAAIAGQKAAIKSGDQNAIKSFTRDLETGIKRSNAILAQSYRELGIQSSQSLEKQRAQAQSAFDAIAKSGVASARDIAAAQANLDKKLGDIDRQLGKVEQSARGAGEGFTIMKGAIASTIGNLAATGIQRAISGILGIKDAIIQAGATAERQKVAFETFTGSAEAAAKVMADVRKFAATTPFELPEVTEAAKQLLAVKVPTDELIPTIKRLGEIAAGADKPLSQLLFIYTQVKNQGRALGQDINQLLNAGLSMDDIAKALGRSAKEMGEAKASSKGLQLSFEDVQKIIVSVTSEGGRFYGLMDKLGATTAVKLSNMNDAFTKIYQNIYDGISPAISGVLDVLIKILDPIGESKTLFQGVNEQAQEFKNYLSQNPALIESLQKGLQDGIAEALKVVIGLSKEFLGILKQNPKAISDTVSALGGLIRGVGWLADKLLLAVRGWQMIFDLIGKIWAKLKEPVPLPDWLPSWLPGMQRQRQRQEQQQSIPQTGSNSRQKAVIAAAQNLGINPVDLASVMSFETGGSLSPSKRGGAGNKYLGLIQFGPSEQRTYGVHGGQSFEEQMIAVERFLRDRGVRPGMGRADIYSAILAGNVRANRNSRDAFGTSVNAALSRSDQLGIGGAHEQKARRFLGIQAASPGVLAPLPVPSLPRGTTSQSALPPPPLAINAAEQKEAKERQQKAAADERARQQKAAADAAAAARKRIEERQQQAFQESMQRRQEAFSYQQREFERDTQAQLAAATDERQRAEIERMRSRQQQDARLEFEKQQKILEFQQAIAQLEKERGEKLKAKAGGQPYTGRDISAQIQLIRDQIKWLEYGNILEKDKLNIQRQQEESLRQQAAELEKNVKFFELINSNYEDAGANLKLFEQAQAESRDRRQKAGVSLQEGAFGIRQAQIEAAQRGGINPFSLAIQQQQLATDREQARYQAEQQQIQQQYALEPDLQARLLGQAATVNQLNLDAIDSQFKDLGETIQDVTQNAVKAFFDAFVEGKDLASAALNVLTSALSQVASQFISSGVSQLFGGLFGGSPAGALAQTAIAAAVPGFASGGLVQGAGSRTSDSILARLSHGEFVVNASAVRSLGLNHLNNLNSGSRTGSTIQISNTFYTPDANSFRQTQAQRDRQMIRDLDRAQR
jgi:hypothetical protein